jgi:Mn-dependent DtxR family transcriptional regulator
VASRIKARHEILTEVLTLLGLESAAVAEEVEEIEHHLRPHTLKLLGKLVNFWKANPQQHKAFAEFVSKGRE